VAVLAAALACTGDDLPEASVLIEEVSQAMADRSFSVVTCADCEPPEITEYAPPDQVELSHAQGHDAWEFNLVSENRWFVSSQGVRWLEGPALELLFLSVTDPRTLLRFAAEPTTTGEEDVDGVTHYVVESGVDADRLLDEVLSDKLWSSEEELQEIRESWAPILSDLAVRFWINAETSIVSQLEIDYPPFASDETPSDIAPTPEDPPPSIVRFDFTAAVEVPTEVESMPAAEVDEKDRLVRDRSTVLMKALEDYKARFGTYPAQLEVAAVESVLAPADWPVNPYSNQPMRQTSDESPGDYLYIQQQGGSERYLRTYGWDSVLDTSISPGGDIAAGE
jgi:hypothetical protein